MSGWALLSRLEAVGHEAAVATLTAATDHRLQVARICHKRLIHDDRCSWNPMVG